MENFMDRLFKTILTDKKGMLAHAFGSQLVTTLALVLIGNFTYAIVVGIIVGILVEIIQWKNRKTNDWIDTIRDVVLDAFGAFTVYFYYLILTRDLIGII